MKVLSPIGAGGAAHRKAMVVLKRPQTGTLNQPPVFFGYFFFIYSVFSSKMLHFRLGSRAFSKHLPDQLFSYYVGSSFWSWLKLERFPYGFQAILNAVRCFLGIRYDMYGKVRYGQVRYGEVW